MEGRVTIVGLGRVGASIGLALRERVPDLEVVGHDVARDNTRQAAKMGAVGKTYLRLSKACDGANLVILALPLPAVREMLEEVGSYLGEGCVVTDTAALKVPVLEWASQFLPGHVHFVTGVPVPGPAVDVEGPSAGPEAARADLYKDGLYCITPTQDTHRDALPVLSALAQVLEARQLFLDPVEYDGLRAGVSDLPAVVALALLRVTIDTPGWLDMRKIAGHDFAALTSSAAGDSRALRATALLNRDNVLRRLDMLTQELKAIRQWLAESREEPLEQAYSRAAEGRARWLKERAERNWGETPDMMAGLPSTGELTARFLVGGPFLRSLRKEKEEEK